MNPFVKAALLTCAVLLLTLILVWQLDSVRENDLQKQISDFQFEMDSNRLVARYGDVMPEEGNICEFLNYTESLQEKKAFSLAYTIQEYERANVLGEEYEQLKRNYFASLADLYLTSFENKKNCPNLRQIPVAYFYSQNDCPQCQIQGEVLTKAAQKCDSVQVFAFPSDSQYSFLKLFVQRYNIGSTPAIVINDSLILDGIISEERLISYFEEMGAVCG